jgi:hypothetical protein
MRRSLLVSALSFSVLLASPGRAVGFTVLGTGGEVDEVGYAQLAQLMALLAQGASTLQTARNALDQGAQTLGTLREINAAVDSTIFLAQNPDEILKQARENFLLSFSELDAINKEAIALNQEVRRGPTGFDANSYRRAYDSSRRSLPGFDLFLAAREKDYGALTERHMVRTAGIQATLNEDRELQNRVNNTTQLTAKESAAISAKANVDTAVSAGVTAQSVSDMLRLMTLKAAQEEQDRFKVEAAAAETVKRLRARTSAGPAALELPLAEGDDLGGER